MRSCGRFEPVRETSTCNLINTINDFYVPTSFNLFNLRLSVSPPLGVHVKGSTDLTPWPPFCFPTPHADLISFHPSVLPAERCMPIAPLLGSLQSMVAADPLCLAEEVAFFGIAALQSHCIDERVALLDIVGRTLDAMPLRDAPRSGGDPGDVDVRVQTWSLETLVYPSVSIAAAGNTAAARVLPLLEAALDDVYSRANAGIVGGTRPDGVGTATYRKSMRYSSAIALGIRRLGLLEDGDQAVLAACEGLRRRASELLHENGGAADVVRDAAAAEDLECSLYLLAPLLLRPHKEAHSAACTALVAVVRAVPTLGVRLLPFVLYAILKLGGAALEDGSVARVLHALPELGAHKFAAKPVAGVVQALAKAPQAAVRGLGLRLAAALVQVNPR